MKSLDLRILILIFFILTSSLYAEISREDKVYILTDHLIKEKSKKIDKELNALTPASPEHKALVLEKKKMTVQARNEAIATVYGKPKFEHLIYDDSSEMFFGRIVSSKGGFVRDVDFYMPRKRARAFKKKLANGTIEIEHAFDGNRLEFRDIELEYKGVNYPLHVVIPNTMSLRVGGYFVGVQDTEIYTRTNGIGATLNLQDLFDMKEQVSVARVSGAYKFNPRHRIEASWYGMRNESHKATSFTYKGQDVNLSGNASLDFKYNTDIYKLNYVYSAYKTSKLELDFRVGLHITQITTGYNAEYDVTAGNTQAGEQFGSDTIAVTVPLPVLGIGLIYEIVPNFMVNFQIDYFALSYDSSVSGSMTDSVLSLEYQFNRYIGIGGGLNRTQTRFNAEVEGTEFGLRDDVGGLIGYVILSY